MIRPVTLWLQVVGARLSADPGVHRLTLDLAVKKRPARVRGHLPAEADKPSRCSSALLTLRPRRALSADSGVHRLTLDLAVKKRPALNRGHLPAEADKPSSAPKEGAPARGL